MNGLILHSSPENKDIKFNAKNSKDTDSKDANQLFESIVSSLIKDEKESKNGKFLLAKLLNLPAEFEKNTDSPSLFSKDEVMDLLKSQSVTKSDKDSDDTEANITLEELFKMALNLKDGGNIDFDDLKLSKDIKDRLNSKDTISDLKNAKNIKELLNIAEKNGIKVKNFDFFKEESAIDKSDKKLVQRVTSSQIFKLTTPKHHKNSNIADNGFDINHKQAKQNLLAKLINETKQPVETASKVASVDQKDNKQTKATTNHHDLNHQEMEAEIESLIKSNQNSSTKKVKESKEKTISQLNIIEEKTSATKNSNEQPENKNQIEDNIDNEQIEKSSHTHDPKEIKVDTSTKTKEPVDVKKSLNTFASEFKEKLESYKAPLMKIKMQLTPQNLGDVDVTLLNRGSTLHVNITSNTQSMALFIQNQAEFKNSLVNMGFSDLQMNFSQNQNGKNQQENKGKNQNNQGFENFSDEDTTESINIAIPNYV